MKKTLIVAAVSALAAGGALAQSSVTLYGRVNVTAERQDSSGAKTFQLVNNASRIGFKGTEDLGGGLKANFILEHGFNIDTGSASSTSFWGRQAEVNLMGGFGGVRMGTFTSEAYFATADYISMHNHDTGPSSDALYAGFFNRSTNKIAYRAPEFVKGLSLEASVSAGEGAVRTTRAYDFAANYNVGMVQLGFGAERDQQREQFAVRALVDMGSLLVGGYIQRDKNGLGSPSAPTGARLGNRTNVRVSVAYMMGKSEFHVNLGSAGNYSDYKKNVANVDSSAKQYTLAYNYNLSKRTKLYTYYTKISDSAASLYTARNAAKPNEHSFSSIAFGVRHNF